MSDLGLSGLIGTALATSIFHTLIPDHWLPFVLIGRARGWSAGITFAVSGLSALVHVVLSVALGLLAMELGQQAAHAIGENLEQAGAVLLVAFGLGYAVWAWRKGGHFHPGGAMVHDEEGEESCHGDEGPQNPEHLHYHADVSLIRKKPGWSAFGLALIVGVNPCILFLPLVLSSAGGGTQALMLVILAYSVPTILLMIGLSVLGVAMGLRFKLPWAARQMEAFSGLLVALLGLAYWIFGH